MPGRWWERPIPMAIVAPIIALAVAFTPLAIQKVLERRRAEPIRIVASPDTSPATSAPPDSAPNVGAAACRSPDDTASRFLSDILRLATSTDAEWSEARSEIGIPRADSGAVALVSDAAVCREVLTAFYGTLPSDWPRPLPTSVYVASVDTVYVGMAPAPPRGEIRAHVVTDARFVVLGQFWR